MIDLDYRKLAETPVATEPFPHLVVPVVTDPKKVLLALRYVVEEMEKRYKIFAKTGVRNITMGPTMKSSSDKTTNV